MIYPAKYFTAIITGVALSVVSACSPTENEQTKSEEGNTPMAETTEAADPFLWLEEVEGEKALAWVEEQNTKSLARLKDDARFEGLMARSLSDYNATDKIAYASIIGTQAHNYWQDATNVRGLWRVKPLTDYASNSGEWETILDLDALAKTEGENWVMKGRSCLAPDNNRCLIRLSRGGGDAVVTREFDMETKSFVEDGFITPESKQSMAWVDADTVMVATNFGEGTMNASGYARQVRVWKRGTALDTAEKIFEGTHEDVFSFPFSSHREDGTYSGVLKGPSFFTQEIHLMVDGALKHLPLPHEIDFEGFLGSKMLVQMRADWVVGEKIAKAGSLISVEVADLIAGKPENSLETVYMPNAESSIQSISIAKSKIYIGLLENVTGKLITATPNSGGWAMTTVDMPANGRISVTSTDDWSDQALVNFESFLTPDTLQLIAEDGSRSDVQSLPARFDASDMVTEQHFATSSDGTKVPYFIVKHADTPMDGSTPTLLYGYGGFEISMTPSYLGGVNKLWLESGGAYVLTNIRGGGEYGPKWHQSVLKENRQLAYDDFIAIAEDIIAAKLTTAAKLGIRGGSNGGLLMGVMTTQRPDLFKAVITAVPLLDMLRYHKLLAGASWVGEYGNPDIAEERAYIAKYSPYQNLKADGTYPEVFYYTSTKDDRVHPGHARKMTAKTMAQGHAVLYYENTEGGHSAAANLKQRAYTDALQVVYLMQKLSD